MSVVVEYRVAVLVEVDEDAGVILSVHVDDERAEGPVGVVPEDGISQEDKERAIAVAENLSWPAWEFGL